LVTQLTSARRRAGLAVVTIASLAVAGLAGTSYASTGIDTSSTTGDGASTSPGQSSPDTYVDVTAQGGQTRTQELRTASRVAQQPATR
jgi:hypothetical protein